MRFIGIANCSLAHKNAQYLKKMYCPLQCHLAPLHFSLKLFCVATRWGYVLIILKVILRDNLGAVAWSQTEGSVLQPIGIMTTHSVNTPQSPQCNNGITACSICM